MTRESLDSSDDSMDELTAILREKKVHLESVTLAIHRAEVALERDEVDLERARLDLKARRQEIRLTELEIESATVALARSKHEFERDREKWRREVQRRLPAGFGSVDELLASFWPRKRRAEAEAGDVVDGVGPPAKKIRPANPNSARPPRVYNPPAECPYPPTELVPWMRICEEHYQGAWDRYVHIVGKAAIGRRRSKQSLPVEYLKSRFPDTWETFKVNAAENG
ncbi:hypothetical protein M427DRAFT_321443 [Gonapodya prolifera JEL478]|uniref:Uncharacterized protein n=1 Tax=Gonapodya prolifera (strain JEL478) TaxID=1344416 RepID=A0A139AG72_GONPJ|nr:hypothetical protein M427DRAFT_321443 [Gonapodya prolifera JEL478]|eukprot:KXS15760.1 hypothetical protein M427DRAFT_321443 [Gonapodya prolifera JEL478]